MVVIQRHCLEPRETSKESFRKCTELVVAQRQTLKTRETSKESIGKCTELVVIQEHFLETRETSKESFGKCTDIFCQNHFEKSKRHFFYVLICLALRGRTVLQEVVAGCSDRGPGLASLSLQRKCLGQLW